MHFAMQHFARVSKKYLNFCLNYAGITNTAYINLSQRYHLGKYMFSIIGINKLPSIITFPQIQNILLVRSIMPAYSVHWGIFTVCHKEEKGLVFWH